MTLHTIGEALQAKGHYLRIVSFSALDNYVSLFPLPFTWLETNADVSVLARLFEDIRFPGTDIADAALDSGETKHIYYFRCIDPDEPGQVICDVLSFYQDWSSKYFHDPLNVYPQLKSFYRSSYTDKPGTADPENNDAPVAWWESINTDTNFYNAALTSAVILSRYRYFSDRDRDDYTDYILKIAGILQSLPAGQKPIPETQRVYLSMLLMSPFPDLGLELLKVSGVLQELWPELALLDDVDHSKEFHPEGNVWRHTLETFRYRKNYSDLILSLGLLFHDSGKPLSESTGNHRFDGHAELGAKTARGIMQRLEFSGQTIDSVYYLVRNHMLPAALPRLPLMKTREVIESPFFPTLLELYRCDESSSFKGLENYYESAAAYKSYLKNVKNPYRQADGKKIKNTYKNVYK